MCRYIYTISNPNGGWDNKEEGKNETISHHRTKRSAIIKGRREAKKRNKEYVIYNLDGTFSKRNHCSSDILLPES